MKKPYLGSTKLADSPCQKEHRIPQRRSPGDTIRRITEAAQIEFGTKGFDVARMESIAHAANVTKQLVYHYFKTKAELYSVLLDDAAKGIELLINNDDYDTLSAPDAMRLLVTRIVDDYVKRPFIARMTLDESIHRGNHIPARSQFLPVMRELIQNTIAPILRRGAEAGHFRDGVDPKIFFLMMFQVTTSCFIHGPLMSLMSDIDFESPEGVALWRRSAIEFLLNSLQAHRGA